MTLIARKEADAVDNLRARVAELERENEQLTQALKWAIDEGGWQLFYHSSVPIPKKAIEIGGDSAKIFILETRTYEIK